MANEIYPELNERTRGWLQFLWDKATTDDDWSVNGKPHEWWDTYSNSPTLSFHRLDLLNSAYSILMMADQTPAWREVYAEILDRLADRHRTHFAALDWLTQFGHDPDRANYPEEIYREFIPPHLRGQYDKPGWTANGIAPYGLQPDPIGAEGMAFFRGFFNFILSSYRYVAADGKWDQPFRVAGCDNQSFEWTHGRIADYLSTQWQTKPAGPHCENTKVWPNCLSIAGLGLKLFDAVAGGHKHDVVPEWLEYVKKNYMAVSKTGGLDWFCRYYDPVIDHVQRDTATTALVVACFLLPQDPEFAAFLYDAAMIENGWNDPSRPIGDFNPRFVSFGLLLARELGDQATESKLRDYVERYYEPRFFGEAGSRFGWWFKLGEAYPRGQWSSVMMLSELGQRGGWSDIFMRPNLTKFSEPTLEGVDYPRVEVSRAWNDKTSGAMLLRIGPVKGSAVEPTEFRVTNLPDPSRVVVTCDGDPFDDFVVADQHITIRTSSAPHAFQIFTGYFGPASGPGQGERRATAPMRDGPPRRRVLRPRPEGMRLMRAGLTFTRHRMGCACCAGDLICG